MVSSKFHVHMHTFTLCTYVCTHAHTHAHAHTQTSVGQYTRSFETVIRTPYYKQKYWQWLKFLIWRSHKDRQINLRHYQSIYTTSMGFSPYGNEICQIKISPTAFSERTAKYNVHLYFCLYGTYISQEKSYSYTVIKIFIATYGRHQKS